MSDVMVVAADLVPGTRIVVQSLPPPLNGRCGKVVTFDPASQAYVVHVDGGNPRTLYRENLRIMEDQSTPVVPVKRQVGRPQAAPRQPRLEGGLGGSSYQSVRPGDQILLCVEQFQFTLMEVTGIRRLCKAEPHSYAIAAVLDDADIPGWMRKPPPVAARPPHSAGANKRVPGFRLGDPIYAVWDTDGRWYPGKIREDLNDRFEIEWMDKEAAPSLVKKSLVCKRTAFEDLRNRPSYLAALNLASRTGGMKGLLKCVEEGGESSDLMKPMVENTLKASLAAAELFPSNGVGPTLSGEEWACISQAMKVLNRFGVDALVNTTRAEVFKAGSSDSSENALQAWLTQGAPPVVATSGFVRPERAILAASQAQTNRPLPRGPLDFIFRPPIV